MVAPSPYYAASPVRRTASSLPFGWGAVTVVLVGAALLIVGILLILYGFLNFLTGTIGAATSSSFSVMGFFQSFFGAIMLFVIGGVLAGVGGWLIRLWWIFLLVGVVTGAGNVGNTARERAERTSDVRVRCRNCGCLNPEFVQFCMACQKPV
ncbi:MAG: hypothetical protein E6K03_00610 [Methanobacteriota archaeon]|nr:MAG: hypothetical protein E6K03_00610 [Euryarchaeota archaeon]